MSIAEEIQRRGWHPTELIVEELTRQAELARVDAAAFFDFVMFDPKSRAKIYAKPHQRVGLEFVSHHRRCVIRWPTDTGKTLSMSVALPLWLLGREPEASVLLAGKTQEISGRPLRMLRDYLEDPQLNARARLVFPDLFKSPRAGRGDLWQAFKLTINRPAGSGDPSITASGLDTSIQGKKFKYIFADDLLDIENTSTIDQRKKVSDTFYGEILNRFEPSVDTRIIFTNVPWDPADLTFELEAAGWPTLTFDIDGHCYFNNVDSDFDTDLVRPDDQGETFRTKGPDGPVVLEPYRLVAHDPDPGRLIPLDPERWGVDQIAELKDTTPPRFYAAHRKCRPRSEEESRCKEEWINRCKRLGRGLSTVSHYDGKGTPFMGVDFGFSRKKKAGETAFWCGLPVELDDKAPAVRILWVHGKRGMSTPDTRDMIGRKGRALNATVLTEEVETQKWAREITHEKFPDLIIRPHATTGRTKQDPEFGLETVFAWIEMGRIVIPCDDDLRCEPEVEKWIEECLSYIPGQHPGDRLMASWFAVSRMMKHGGKKFRPRFGGQGERSFAKGGAF